MTRRSVRLKIYGRVQGVNFRYAARQRASALGLNGWVRNCPDGSVELLATGDPDAVNRLIKWSQHGPSGASVDRVDIEEEPSAAESAGPFAIW